MKTFLLLTCIAFSVSFADSIQSQNNIESFHQHFSESADVTNSTQSALDSPLPQDLSQDSPAQSPAKLNADLSIMGLYKNADIVVKSVVCILIGFSLLTWAVFLGKFFEFYTFLKRAKRDISALLNHKPIESFSKDSYAKQLYSEFKDELSKSVITDSTLKSRIKYRLEHRAASVLASSKAWVSLLASVGSSAPFIGLFGTVWGIMDAFIGIAKSDNTSLAVVAPGIAEALFATAFGLAAAIPAVLFYNWLIRLSVKFNAFLSEILTQVYCAAEREIHANTK